MYFIMIFCVLGVLAFDYSRAHAVRARLMTAADAAALAACMEAETIPEYEYKMYDPDGNVTDDPTEAVEVKAEIAGYYADLQNRQWEALDAARKTFAKNVVGHKMPVKSTALPVWCASSGSGNIASGNYFANGSVMFDRPKYAKDGSVYYDEYKFEATAGVRTFLIAGPLGKWFAGAVQKDSSLPEEWQGVIPVKVEGTAQALPSKTKN
jgi:hypothetical protein